RGILGVLIEEARPLRLADIAADPRAHGFPPPPPPMRAVLGAPVRARREVALREVATAILQGEQPDAVLALVARRARELAGADLALLGIPDAAGSVVIRAGDRTAAGAPVR